MKRKLNTKEKSLIKNQIKHMELDMEMSNKIVEVISNEIEMLPRRTEIAMYNKKKELAQVVNQVIFNKNKIDLLKKQINQGVEVKDNANKHN